MKTAIGLAVAFATTAMGQDNKIVPLTFRKAPFPSPRATYGSSTGIHYRDGNVVTTVQIGSPGQSITMRLDTSASSTFVVPPDVHLCYRCDVCVPSSNRICPETFDSNKSSTFKTVAAGGFHEKSIPGPYTSIMDWVKGDVGSDTFTLGDTSITHSAIGIVDEVGSEFLGSDFAYMGLLAGDSAAKTPRILGLLDQLEAQGRINSRAFSVYWVITYLF